MFIRMQALENDLDTINQVFILLIQKKQKDNKKSNPIDSFFNFLGGSKKNEKSNEQIKEENRNVIIKSTSNNIGPINSNENVINKQTKNNEETIVQKTSIQIDSTPPINNQNSFIEETPSTINTSSVNEEKSIKLLDKMKALKKKNTEKIVTNNADEKKEEINPNVDGTTK